MQVRGRLAHLCVPYDAGTVQQGVKQVSGMHDGGLEGQAVGTAGSSAPSRLCPACP